MTLLQPSVGLPDFWAGSGFEDKLLQAQGDFSLNAGPAQCDLSAKRRDDRYGLPIATYEMEAEKYIYRVYKYEL